MGFFNSFDIFFAACVFHHIEHDEHARLCRELRRVLRKGGMGFVFEHNPYNPLTVRAVNTCPFDENARLVRPRVMKKIFELAGIREPRIQYRIFFPRLLGWLRPVERGLTWMPLGAQYYVVATK